MDEENAREILKDAIQPDNSLYNCREYIAWPSYRGSNLICIDGTINVEYLEAVVWWTKNKKII